MAEKTEQPTPRRLRRAQQEGNLAVSGALTQAVSFLFVLTLLPGVTSSAGQLVSARLEQALATPPWQLDPTWIAWDVLRLAAPLLMAGAAGALAVGFVQTGGVVAVRRVAPDLARANPFAGLANLVTTQRFLAVARSLVAAIVVSALVARELRLHAAALAHTVGNIAASVVLAKTLAHKITWVAAMVGLGLGVADLVVTRRGWMKRLRMSKDEVKREHRESEGDPELKAARQRAHQEVLKGASLAAIREATVLVINPTHLAVALRYLEEEDEAPRVVAQGEGELARSMIEAARAYNVPVVRDVPVARALHELEVGDEIPEVLFEAVAEILRTVWDGEKRPPE